MTYEAENPLLKVDEEPEEPPYAGPLVSDLRKRGRGIGGAFLGFDRVKKKPKVRGRLILRFAIIWLFTTVLLAILANWLPIRNPNDPIGVPNLGPNWGRELLGLDAVGRSMISRLIYGARASYVISICVTLLALTVGSALGLLAVFFRGIASFIADVICNTLLSVPGLLLLLTLSVVFHASLLEIILAIAVVFVPNFTRLTRAVALSQIELNYVDAARGLGASAARIILKELLPNTLLALVTFACIALPGVMLVEGALSFLGFGLPPPTPSWGQMIAQGYPAISQAPWAALIPAIVFAVTVFSVYTIGDWVRARIDVKGFDSA